METKDRLEIIKNIRLNIQEFVIPKPEGSEDEQTFIGRCMSDLKTDFPDQKQRYAVCKKTWDEK